MKIKFTSIKKLLTTKLMLIAMLSAVATFCIYSNSFSLTSSATGNFESLSETETDSFSQSDTEDIDMEIDTEIETNMFMLIDINDLSSIDDVEGLNVIIIKQISEQIVLDLIDLMDEENQDDNTNIINNNLNESQNLQMDEDYINREINYIPPELLPIDFDEALNQHQNGISETLSESQEEE